jgi:putative transposase
MWPCGNGCARWQGSAASAIGVCSSSCREGFAVNHKRLFRIYREERLMVRKRGGRKRALGRRMPMPVPLAPNDRWSLDFVSDQFVCGRRFRILANFDDCTRECLAAVADIPLSSP